MTKTTVDTQPDATVYTMDSYIGSKLRQRRRQVGISQDFLAEALGITFQQVQKYEKGTNRMTAARIWECARLLDTTVMFFYDGMDKNVKNIQKPLTFGLSDCANDVESESLIQSSDDIIELVNNFSKIKDVALKKTILNLVKSVLDTETQGDKALKSMESDLD